MRDMLPNESPEPPGAALPVFQGRDKFAAPWLRRCALTGTIGSALRSAYQTSGTAARRRQE